MTSRDIRRIFIEFYAERDHAIRRSAPLLPVEDATLLFNSAGMVPFKKMWTMEEPPFRRAASVQKCLRATDLEDVGRTPRHCTFFEMLGHFSFGDYFKREAIVWNWELFRNRYGIPAEKLKVSVHQEDDEAFAIWRDEVGIAEDRIYRLGDEHNFWGPAGDTGPCGPSSEVFYDLGESLGCGREACGPGCDCDRWVEIGNFVFPQFDAQPDGTRAPLRNPGIDTGIGLERVAMVTQGVASIFETDLFIPMIRRVEEMTGRPYRDNRVAMNIIADHVRALTFALAEGIMPGHEGRGYVVRRILRRAALQGHFLGLREAFLAPLAGTAVEVMGEAYPEIVESLPRVAMALSGEEERFFETVEAGVHRFDKLAEEVKSSRSRVMGGREAFILYDTYGFPLDLVRDMSRREGLTVDESGFWEHMEQQKEQSRRSATFYRRGEAGFRWTVHYEGEHSRFVGYERLEARTRLQKSAPIAGAEGEFWAVFEETPFYSESGGQVGDVGRLAGQGLEALVIDTQKGDEGILHRIRIQTGRLGPDAVTLTVDAAKRAATMRNHTATHLLHAALRKVLGPHVTQAGSLVAPDRLRFDFTHYGPVGADEIREVERLVRQRILENSSVKISWSSYDEAIGEGITALFGEKYDETSVRRIEVGQFSRELCGGTHVWATGDIGPFLILEEGAISAGVRRIEAAAGELAAETMRRMQEILQELRRALKVPEEDLVKRVLQLQEDAARLKREVRDALEKGPAGGLEALLQGAESVGARRLVVGRTEAPSVEIFRRQGDQLAKALGSGAGLLAARVGNKISLLAVVTPDLASSGSDLRADRIVQEVAAVAGGRGGGNPQMALAGVGDPSRLEEALAAARELLRKALKG